MRNVTQKAGKMLIVFGMLSIVGGVSSFLLPTIGYVATLPLPLIGIALVLYIIFMDLDKMQRKALAFLAVFITTLLFTLTWNIEVRESWGAPPESLFPPLNFLIMGSVSVVIGSLMKYSRRIKRKI